MQFDRTHVVIRQRNAAEVADLAVVLIRRYTGPLLICWLTGALPFIILNTLLVGWIPTWAHWDGLVEDELYTERARYLWLLSVLVYLQAPLGCLVMTAWLGRAVFQDRPTWRQVAEDLNATKFRWLYLLGFVRGPLLLMAVLLCNWGREFSGFLEIFVPILALLLFGMMRIVRPYLPEILVLERCPIRSKHPSVIIVGVRSRLLHMPSAADVSGRAMLISFFAVVGTAALGFGLLFVRNFLTLRVGWTLDVFLIILPLAMWLVAGCCAVVRFLNYLDTRIRLEGWEVDLKLRAEAERWLPSATASSHSGSPRPAAGVE